MPSKGSQFEVRNWKLVNTTTEADAREAFQKLVDLDTDKMLKDWACQPTYKSIPMTKTLGMLSAGNSGRRFSNFYHWQDRSRVDKPMHGGGILPNIHKVLERWKKRPEGAEVAKRRLRKWHPTFNEAALLYKVAERSSAFMSVAMFPPSISKYFCDRLQPHAVLDMSAGWGDRLAGFLASPSVDAITLIEPRASAAPNYRAEAKLAARAGHKKKLRIMTDGAENAMPKLVKEGAQFDLIITSPPYFSRELYDPSSKNAHLQVANKYGTSQEYLEGFLFPVAAAAAKCLSKTGVLALNIDDNEKHGVKICAPLLKFMKKQAGIEFVGTMALRKEHTKNSTNLDPEREASDAKYCEPIYCWARTGFASTARRLLKQQSSLPVQRD